MVNKVTICWLNPNIEEDIVIDIEGFKIECFANVCPYKINVGETHNVEMGFTIFDDWVIEEAEFIDKGDIVKTECGEQYYIYGRLNNDILEVQNIKFQDDMFLSEYAYLNGKFVSLLVDRINVAFI